MIEKYYDTTKDFSSPVQKDYDRVEKFDEDGNSFIVYQEVDYPAIIASFGSVYDWSLSSLLKAGINPNFSIHTGNPTRLEGVGVIEDAQAMVDSIFAEIEKDKEN